MAKGLPQWLRKNSAERDTPPPPLQALTHVGLMLVPEASEVIISAMSCVWLHDLEIKSSASDRQGSTFRILCLETGGQCMSFHSSHHPQVKRFSLSSLAYSRPYRGVSSAINFISPERNLTSPYHHLPYIFKDNPLALTLFH